MKKTLLVLLALPLLGFGQFDFDYSYDNYDMGVNPPIIYPIGLSYNGKIAFKIDYCNSGCGCCSEAIFVQDLETNTILYKKDTDLAEWAEGNNLGHPLKSIEYHQDLTKIIQKYGIMPFGFGTYQSKSKVIQVNYSDSIEIVLEKRSDDRYQLKRNYKDKVELISTLEVPYCEDFGEELVYGDINYAGYFMPNEISNYSIVVLMYNSPCGYEQENDYWVEFIGIKLPKTEY
ncbi:MAG: hypothetical protein O2781_05355 [Bacteroidetes bacterium]|jgi:hypothetical protein|nr:hypothetical protein [Bacteroidota bacterium]